MIKKILNIQISRFLLVGGTAALVNLVLVGFFVSQFNLQPLHANIYAFLCAFLVSYNGQRHFTFKSKQKISQTSMLKFFVVAAFAFALNEALYYLLLKYLSWHYLICLFTTLLIVAVFTFIFSKWWAFKPKKSL